MGSIGGGVVEKFQKPDFGRVVISKLICGEGVVIIIIIIIFHFILATYRLWQSNLHILGIQPMFNLSPPCFLSAILLRSSSAFSFV